ncbi:MAG: glycosyltransferase family 4 protein [Cyclobacteriaceae bacterium]
MRVLFLPSWYSKDANGFVGSYIRDLAEALVGLGVEVHLLYCDKSQVHQFGFKRNWKNLFGLRKNSNNGVFEVRFSLIKIPFMESLNWLIWCVVSRIILRSYVNRYGQPDLIHAHSSMWASNVAYYAKKTFGIPYVVTEHRGSFIKGSGVKISEKVQSRICKYVTESAQLIMVSEAQRDFFSTADTKKLVVPNFVNDIFLSQGLSKSVAKKRKIVSICHLTKQKNVNKLICAIHQLKHEGCLFELTIIGDGSERAHLVNLVKKLDLIDNVRFTGFMNPEGIVSELKNSDLFVMTSKFESFGIVFIEAMACGLPVIGTFNGGPHYFIEDFNGLTVDTESVQEVVDAIVRVSEKEYNHTAISNMVKQKYSKENIVSQILNVYKDVVV